MSDERVYELTITWREPFVPMGRMVPVRIETEGGLHADLRLEKCTGPMRGALLNLFAAEDIRVMPSDDGKMICILAADPDDGRWAE